MYPSPTAGRTGPGRCPDCERAVIWCLTTRHQKRIAIDPNPDPTGNQAVSVRDTTYWARQLSGDRPNVEDREVLRQPHVASCPVAKARAAAAKRRLTAHYRNTARAVRPAPWRTR